MSDSNKELHFADVFEHVRDALSSPLLVSYAVFIRLQIESLISLYEKDPEEARFTHMSQADVMNNVRMNGPLKSRKFADDVHQILHAIYRACEQCLRNDEE